MSPYVKRYMAMLSLVAMNDKSLNRDRISESEAVVVFIMGVHGMPVLDIPSSQLYKDYMSAEHVLTRSKLLGDAREARSKLAKKEEEVWKALKDSVQDPFATLSGVTYIGEYGEDNNKAWAGEPERPKFKHESPAQYINLLSRNHGGTSTPILGSDAVESFVESMRAHRNWLIEQATEHALVFDGELPNGTGAPATPPETIADAAVRFPCASRPRRPEVLMLCGSEQV
jgi:hypothetical protein